MKAKLIKMVEGYTLSLTGSIDDLYGISNQQLAEDHQLYKLSLKNCEAIANGYNLDELAEKATNKQLIRILSGEDKEEVLDDIQKRKFYFKKGFQKALELLGDKKFSESDMIHAYIEGTNDGAQFESMMDYDHSDNSEAQNFSEQAEQDFRKLLQKNEWDVEIITEPFLSVGDNLHDKYQTRPKLDADGCLILTRK